MARELQLFESNIVVTFTNPQERVTAAINRETPPPPHNETLCVVAMCVCNQIPIYWRNISTSERSEAIFVLPQPSARAKSRAANPRVLSEISIARRLGVWMIPRFGRIRMQAIGFAGMAVGMLMLLATVGLTNSRLHSPLVFVEFILFNLLIERRS